MTTLQKQDTTGEHLNVPGASGERRRAVTENSEYLPTEVSDMSITPYDSISQQKWNSGVKKQSTIQAPKRRAFVDVHTIAQQERKLSEKEQF